MQIWSCVQGEGGFDWGRPLILLPPDHPVYHSRIGLDDLHHFRRYIDVRIIRHRYPTVSVSVHLHRL